MYYCDLLQHSIKYSLPWVNEENLRRKPFGIVTFTALQAYIKEKFNHSFQDISLTLKRSLHLSSLYLQLITSHRDNELHRFGVSQKAILCVLLSSFFILRS